MSENFKDKLNARVYEVRREIKKETVDDFITLLKNYMTNQSDKGLRNVKIFTEDIYMHISEKVNMDILENILTEESEELENDRPDLLDWLLEEVYKTRIFRGIDIEYRTDVDDRQYLRISWSS